LAEQIDRADGIHQREILRRRDDHRARRFLLRDHRELHIARARRQIDDDRVRRAPIGIDQLAERVSRHRPAPRDRLPRLNQMPDREHRHAKARRHGLQPVSRRHRLCAFGAHQARLRRTINVRIDQSGAQAEALQRNREIGAERRFAHTALTARHRDEPPAPLFRCKRDPHRRDAGNRCERGLDLGLERVTRPRVEPGHIEDEARAAILKTRRCCAALRGGYGGKRGGELGDFGHATRLARESRRGHCFSGARFL